MQQLETVDTLELAKLLSESPQGLPLFASDGSQFFSIESLVTRELKEGIRHFCELTLEPCRGGKITTQPVSSLLVALKDLDTFSHLVGTTVDGQTYRVLEIGNADLGSGPVVLLKIELSE